jgi:hypothetical protein
MFGWQCQAVVTFVSDPKAQERIAEKPSSTVRIKARALKKLKGAAA